MDVVQMAHDHNHQRLQEEAIRVEFGPVASGGNGRHRDNIGEHNKYHQKRGFVYNIVS